MLSKSKSSSSKKSRKSILKPSKAHIDTSPRTKVSVSLQSNMSNTIAGKKTKTVSINSGISAAKGKTKSKSSKKIDLSSLQTKVTKKLPILSKSGLSAKVTAKSKIKKVTSKNVNVSAKVKKDLGKQTKYMNPTPRTMNTVSRGIVSIPIFAKMPKLYDNKTTSSFEIHEKGELDYRRIILSSPDFIHAQKLSYSALVDTLNGRNLSRYKREDFEYEYINRVNSAFSGSSFDFIGHSNGKYTISFQNKAFGKIDISGLCNGKDQIISQLKNKFHSCAKSISLEKLPIEIAIFKISSALRRLGLQYGNDYAIELSDSVGRIISGSYYSMNPIRTLTGGRSYSSSLQSSYIAVW